LNSEVVVIDHVKEALALMGPAGKSALIDWIKGFAFLFLGIAITLGLKGSSTTCNRLTAARTTLGPSAAHGGQ
jgi:hypothetical protein